MDGIWQQAIDLLGPSGPFYVIAAIGMVLALVALPFVLRREKDPVDRLGTMEDRRDIELATLRTDRDGGALRGIGEYLQPGDDGELSETRKRLAAAGYKDLAAVRVYYFARAALGVGLLLVGLVFFFVLPEEPNLVMGIAMSVAFGLAGYFAPVDMTTASMPGVSRSSS